MLIRQDLTPSDQDNLPTQIRVDDFGLEAVFLTAAGVFRRHFVDEQCEYVGINITPFLFFNPLRGMWLAKKGSVVIR